MNNKKSVIFEKEKNQLTTGFLQVKNVYIICK